MKTLYLLRHAKSSRSPGWENDFERTLADRGRRDAPAIGAWMSDRGMLPSLTLYSTARRAIETWRLIEPHLRGDLTEKAVDSLYLAAPGDLFKTVAAVDDGHESVLIVSHNPGLHELALILVRDGAPADLARLGASYPTGALSEFRFDIARWSELRPESGRLERLLFPRDLADAG